MIDLFAPKKDVIDMKKVLIQAIQDVGDPLVENDTPSQDKKTERTLIIESLSTPSVKKGIPKPKKYRKIRDDLLEWKNNDFALYISKKYISEYHDVWQFPLMSITMYLDRIKDKIDNVLGFCDNITFKDYVDYFFKNWSDDYKNKHKTAMLTLKSFTYSAPIKGFVSQYHYRDRVKAYNKEHDKTVKSAVFVNNKRLREAFLLGAEHFVLEYGLVLPVNWMVVCDDRELKEAANYIAKAMYSLYQKGRLEEIFIATKKYAPYPKWLFFKDHQILINSLNKKTNNSFRLDIDFTGDKGFSFLRSKIVNE